MYVTKRRKRNSWLLRWRWEDENLLPTKVKQCTCPLLMSTHRQSNILPTNNSDATHKQSGLSSHGIKAPWRFVVLTTSSRIYSPVSFLYHPSTRKLPSIDWLSHVKTFFSTKTWLVRCKTILIKHQHHMIDCVKRKITRIKIGTKYLAPQAVANVQVSGGEEVNNSAWQVWCNGITWSSHPLEVVW